VWHGGDQSASQVDVGGILEQHGNALVECEHEAGSDRAREFGFDETDIGTSEAAGSGSVRSGHAGERTRSAAKR
jgi:hypothetical protein